MAVAPGTLDALVILAGGRSRRMGTEKALLAAPDGTTLLECALRAVAPRFAALGVSVGAAGPSPGVAAVVVRVEDALGRPVLIIPDGFEGAGPLAAVASSLEEVDAPFVHFRPVDAPGVSFELAAALGEEASSPGNTGAIARWSRGLEPAHGVYCRCLLPAIGKLLEAGERSLQSIATLPGVALLDLEDEGVRRRVFGPAAFPDLADLFRNLNTPEEHSAWLGGRSG
jgi:molybdopterin-guanine dinucleotide biosynthesis protein A